MRCSPKCVSVLRFERDYVKHVVAQFSASTSERDVLLRQTRTSVDEHLHTAQELSLLRHSLSDELASLSEDLLSSMSDDPQNEPTLLENIEALHRNLKELESVNGYLLVLERALRLRSL